MKNDYKILGFKAGLEIHQQLDTHKLFCECPSVLRTDKPFNTIKRKIHVVAGESGEIDEAVKFQGKGNKDYFYQTYDTTCLVELDEEPPHKINKEALKIATEIALLLNCKIFPVTQIMRKTIVNGSNTSGFQRTVLIAYGGFIQTSEGKVGIDSIYLEEDSARPIEKTEDSTTYRLDRLGIPLVEISTKPDLKSASQVKETALKIGEILRSSKVRRGLGTIRQDLNISIKGSNRVEIKGFQDSKIMEKCIDLEVERQKMFLDKNQKNPSEVRNCLPDGTTEFLRPIPGSARMYPETDLELLHIKKEFIDEIKRNLPKLKNEIEEELRKQGLSEEMIKLIFKYSGEISMSSDLSNKLSYELPDKFVVVAFLKGARVNISIRGENAKGIVEKAIKEFPLAKFGGHRDAVGAQMDEDELDKFKENLEKILD